MFGPYIVLEGPDGAGKTTLAEQILSEVNSGAWPFGIQAAHFGPPNRLAYLEWINAATEREGPTLFDRLHLGSIAYGKAFRGMFDVSDHENWLVEGLMMSRGLRVVHADVPGHIADQNIERVPDPNAATRVFEDPGKRGEVRQLYRDYFDNRLEVRSNSAPILYDYTVHDKESTARMLAAWMDREIAKRDTPFLRNVVGLGDPLTAKRVLVGDELHGLTKARRRAEKMGVTPREELRFIRAAKTLAGPLAYTTFPGNGSGRYLHMCFRMAGFTLEDTFVMNAYTWDGAQTQLDGFAEWASDREVICLGNEAYDATRPRLGGIPVRKVPHPQFWRRFHYARQSDYAKLLKGEAVTVG